MALTKNKKLADDVIRQINKIREEEGISKYSIAHSLNASWNTLHNIFEYKTDTTLGTLTAILDAMGLKIKIVNKYE